jgi:hypothetical protein
MAISLMELSRIANARQKSLQLNQCHRHTSEWNEGANEHSKTAEQFD